MRVIIIVKTILPSYLSSFSTGLVSACWDLLFLSSTEELEIREMSTEKTLATIYPQDLHKCSIHILYLAYRSHGVLNITVKQSCQPAHATVSKTSRNIRTWKIWYGNWRGEQYWALPINIRIKSTTFHINLVRMRASMRNSVRYESRATIYFRLLGRR